MFLGANRELVGVRPLHLAFARPLCLLERPTGAIHCFRNRKAFSVYWFFSRASCRAAEVILLSGAWRSHIVPYSGGFGKCFFKVFLHFSLFVYKYQFFNVFRPVFDTSLPYYNIDAQTPAVLHRRGPELIQFFSSCFISCSVSHTAAASTGSREIKPIGAGPSTL